MRLIIRHNILLFTADVIILLLCIAGVEHCRLKAGLHANYDAGSGTLGTDTARVVTVTESETILQVGDILTSVSGFRIQDMRDVEQILDLHAAGDTISMEFRRGGSAIEASYTLTRYYSAFDIVMQGGGVLIFFALGFFVLSRKPEDAEALVFHQLSVTVAGVLAFTHGYLMMEPYGSGHLLRALLPSTYAFIGVFVLHFSFVYPTPRELRRTFLLMMYAVPLLPSLLAIYASYSMTMPFTLDNAPLYYQVFALTKAIMIVGAVAGIAVMIVKFRRTRETTIRRQIAWVVLGIGFSVFVYVVPWLLTTSPVVHSMLAPNISDILDKVKIEESLLTLSLVLTASFMAIGIIRYRFFDIEFFFKRGTIATTVILLLVALYSAVLYGLTELTGAQSGMTIYAMSLIALIAVLILFLPVRSTVRRTVDRWFFRVEYDFREHLTRISRLIGETVEEAAAARVLTAGIDDLMHVEGALVLLVREDGWLETLARSGFPKWRAARMQVHPERIAGLPDDPLVTPDMAEDTNDVQELRMAFTRRFGIVLLMPIRREDGSVLGLLLLGKKRSETRFTLDDLDLLRTLCRQTGLQIQRLQLQETLMLEKQEAAKLRELSQMKSYFVSGVSHDLKTPLTSIKLFAELLEQRIPKDDTTGRKHVGIIQGECDRLARLINNVLDFTKIERGTMQYSFAPTRVCEVVRNAYDIMQYQFTMSKIECTLHCDESIESVEVEADSDALVEAMTNLLSNAIKYSGNDKRIAMRTRRAQDRVCIDIEDHGLGIAAEDLEHLFEPFYRSTSGDVQKRGGVGLGLALVKHIIDAHQGNIHVRSVLGEGSTFTLSLHTMEAE